MRVSVRSTLSGIANDAVRLLLSPACAACQGRLDHPVEGSICDTCWIGIVAITAPWCRRCGDAVPSSREADAVCERCRSSPPPYDIARSAGVYDGALREIVHAFKYRRRRGLAQPLAALMRRAGAEVLDGADAAVPVPLHPWRALSRGFNQADDLARHLGLPVWRVLRRPRYGPPQAALTASGRRVNAREAFNRWSRPYCGLVGHPWTTRLRNRTVVLVDDVMTTGATVDACCQVLLEAGAARVSVLTLARAVTTPHLRRPPPRGRAAAPRR
jgi:ComF family protein